MNKSQIRQPTGSNEIKRYLNIFKRNWYWFLFSIMFSLAIAKVINVLAPRSYKVSCEIAVGENENLSPSSTELVEGMDFNQMNPIRKEIGILKSKNLAEQTVSELDFDITYYELIKGTIIKRRRYNEMPFLITTDSTDKIIAKKNIYLKVLEKGKVKVHVDGNEDKSKTVELGDKFSNPNISFNINLKESIAQSLDEYTSKEYLFYFNDFTDIVNTFWKNLEIITSPMSQNILILSVTSENANQSIAYLNKLYELYDKNDLQVRNRMASNTITFIDGQLSLLNEQLSQAEDSLIRFKRLHHVFQSEINTMISDDFVRIDKEITEKKLLLQNITETQLKLDSILHGGNIIIPYLLSKSDVRLEKGVESINKLVIERDVLLQNQKVNSPAIIKITQQLEVEIKAFQSYLDQQKDITNKQMVNLTKELAKIEVELLNLPTVERHLAKLTRDFQLTENLYNLYQQRRIEAKLAEASTVSKIRMLDPPDRETAIMVEPKKRQNIQIGVLLALLIPAVLFIIYDLITNQVREFQDILIHVNLPVVGKIVHSRANFDLPTKEFPWAAITESFRTLLAKLKYLLVNPKQNVIAITSGSSGEGKTFCAMNLATIIAASGKKVLLMGLDLRRPKIHEVFNINNNTGLTTYLIGKSTREEIIHETYQNNLFLMNSGPIPPNPVELIEHQRMSSLLDKCRKEYDFVVIDSPPIGLVADALLITKLIDLYLFVIRMDYTKKNIIGLLKEIQESDSLKRLSLVFNDIKEPERYGYGYGYYNNYYQKEEILSVRKRLFKGIFRKS
ncbi:MAG: polysaccharide biosynthesis tyrosine autokinase [Bacteroidales bacterium]|nr:polysaccharide biosynthesis tyrosine autokinase [Bacteroidales bacterium]